MIFFMREEAPLAQRSTRKPSARAPVSGGEDVRILSLQLPHRGEGGRCLERERAIGTLDFGQSSVLRGAVDFRSSVRCSTFADLQDFWNGLLWRCVCDFGLRMVADRSRSVFSLVD